MYVTSIPRQVRLLTPSVVVWAVGAKDIVDHSGDKNIGNGAGKQFINGACTSNADCATDCCATFPDKGVDKGVCSGKAADTLNTKEGCGFGN
ncbi:hypothetical protein G6O67_000207 [Ophiocordyceps sinensis]|uniref:Biotrophy-associated secreted protein 2 n=1 Tax=Ophiocordyceps sinensis TaxID=72228 RepID=A0A8H4PYI2_9HYPO|nr:hypothetical protein G6O67_000207 [Ophiocordyceps sinensis]